MRLNGSISEGLFVEKNNRFEHDLLEISEKKQSMKLPEMRAKAQKVIELAGCLYKAYQGASDALKAKIIKSNVIELSVTSKKELLIRESPLMQCSKIVNFSYGTPELIDYRTFAAVLHRTDGEALGRMVDLAREILKGQQNQV